MAIVIAESNCIAHTFDTDVQSIEGLRCDPWHVSGNQRFHSNADEAALMTFIKQKLPERRYKFEIGFTGYIDWNIHPFGRYGWSTDSIGREVVCLGDWWGFRRYVHGDTMVWYHKDAPSYLRTSSKEILKILTNVVESYQPSSN